MSGLEHEDTRAAAHGDTGHAWRVRWERFVAWCTTREDSTPLAVVRIALCTTLVLHLARHVALGGARFAWVHESLGGAGSTHGALSWIGGATPTNVLALSSVLIAAGVLGAVGLFTRPALLVAWLSLRVLSDLNPSARGGYDPLMVNALFLLLWSGSHTTLSLDARWFARVRDAGASSWRCVRVLVVLQIAVLYGTSAFYKLGSGWVPGGDASALWYILQQPIWARMPDLVAPWMVLPLQLATTSTWLWELSGLPFFFVFLADERRSRRITHALRIGFLAFGVGMHVGIELLMEVGAFSWAALSLYAAAVPLSFWSALRARFTR